MGQSYVADDLFLRKAQQVDNNNIMILYITSTSKYDCHSEILGTISQPEQINRFES